MKKSIYLMLVFGIASAANASMVLELRHGAGSTVDIYATSGYRMGDDMYFAVVGDTSEVTVSGGSVVIPPAPTDTAIYGDDAQLNGMCTAPLDGMWGILCSIGGVSAPVGTYIRGINWSLVGGATEAEIILIGTPDFATFDTLSTITVPEPMTIALLGLGGLLLLRWRR
jgi:hypothetical protein